MKHMHKIVSVRMKVPKKSKRKSDPKKRGVVVRKAFFLGDNK